MIEKFFTQQRTLFRMRESILGPYLPAIAKALAEAHYATATIRLHLRAAGHFGVWLEENNITLADVTEVTVDRYVQGLDRPCSRSTPQGRLPHSALG